MHLRFLLASLIGLAVLVASCSDQNETPRNDPGTSSGATGTPVQDGGNARPTAPGTAEHEGERAMEHVRYLAGTIGPRVSGTSQERQAAEYIREQFESYGYTVELMEFTYEGDRFQAGAVRAGEQVLDSLALAGSSGGTATGRAVFVGLGDAAGIAGKSLEGAVAIADRGEIRFAEKYENVRNAGARALVIVNNADGLYSGSVGEAATIPVVGVALEDRELLLRAASAGAEITVEAPDPSRSTALNVIARPEEGAYCRVVVGGHHDTVPGAPGANDNASGTANVIELARAMAVDGLEADVCFVTFGAEESGLFGSAAFVRTLREKGRLPEIMMNLDVTGIGRSVEVIGTPELVTKAVELGTALNIAAVRSSLPPNTGSDHQSFANEGVPVVYFSSGGFPTIHSPGDVVDDIEVESLERIGRLALATLREIAG
jgi:aminopeptidase YwaD